MNNSGKNIIELFYYYLTINENMKFRQTSKYFNNIITPKLFSNTAILMHHNSWTHTCGKFDDSDKDYDNIICNCNDNCTTIIINKNKTKFRYFANKYKLTLIVINVQNISDLLFLEPFNIKSIAFDNFNHSYWEYFLSINIKILLLYTSEIFSFSKNTLPNIKYLKLNDCWGSDRQLKNVPKTLEILELDMRYKINENILPKSLKILIFVRIPFLIWTQKIFNRFTYYGLVKKPFINCKLFPSDLFFNREIDNRDYHIYLKN